MYVHIVSLRSTSTKLYYWARNQINSPKAKCTVLHTYIQYPERLDLACQMYIVG